MANAFAGRDTAAEGKFTIGLTAYVADGTGELPAGQYYFAGRLFGLVVTVELPVGDWAAKQLVPPMLATLRGPLSGEALEDVHLAPVSAAGGLGAQGGLGAAIAASQKPDATPDQPKLFDDSAPPPIPGDLNTHMYWQSQTGWMFIADATHPRLELSSPLLNSRPKPAPRNAREGRR